MKEFLIDYKKTAEKISEFLKKEFVKRNKTKAILGLSGGIDSAVCGFLCKKAGLDLYGIILPYKNKGLEGKKTAKALGLPKNRLITLDIASLADTAMEKIEKINKMDKVDKGNIMARQRMVVQYALARMLGGLVIGTENLSEYYLGYFTRHGDEACDIAPIAGLWKTQVRSLARYLGIPREILEKQPSAGFWPGQTDEKELGFTYEQADKIMHLAVIKNYAREKIIKKGLSSKLVNKVLERVAATQFKRQAPPKFSLK